MPRRPRERPWGIPGALSCAHRVGGPRLRREHPVRARRTQHRLPAARHPQPCGTPPHERPRRGPRRPDPRPAPSWSLDRPLREHFASPRDPLATPPTAPRPGAPPPPGVRLAPRVTAFLHRFGDFFPSTPWGRRSCPKLCPQGSGVRSVRAAQGAVDSWTKDLHRVWKTSPPPGCGKGCPPRTHRLGAVFPSDRALLHMAVHCSATRKPRSPHRVKAVTRSCRVGLWETWVNLGTHLGRTRPSLGTVCAELSVLHRTPELSTGSMHRVGG